MTSLMSNIFRIYILTVFVILISISGCSDDPSSPQKEEDDEPLVGSTIGAEGGTIGTDDISIIIPPGAFNNNNEIAIYDVADDGAFGENTISPSMRISGIPHDFAKSIKIKMKYSGELSEESFIVSGTKELDYSTDDSSTVYSFLTTSDSSGYLVGVLPSNNTNNFGKAKIDLTPIDRLFKALNKIKITETKYFKIYHPLIFIIHAERTGEILDNLLDDIKKDLNLSFYPRNIKQSISVNYTTTNVDMFYVQDQVVLGLNTDLLISQDNNQIKVEMAKLLLGMEWIYGGASLSWLTYAITDWAGGNYNDNPSINYVSNFVENALQPFDGLENNANEKRKDHSAGMSAVIEYLINNNFFGIEGIEKAILFSKENPSFNGTKVLLNIVDELFTEWWPDFFKEYVDGNVFNVPFGYFLDHPNAIWDIDTIEDTLMVFKASEPIVGLYPDLSAKIFKINLDHNNFEESQNMLFSMDAPGGLAGLALVLFGINKTGESEYLGTANAQDFEIPNLKSYSADMKQFLVVLVNCLVKSDDYLGSTDIDLKVEINKPKKYTRLSIDYRILNKLHNEKTGNVGFDEIWETNGETYDDFIIEGTFSGDTFSGSYIDINNTTTSTRTNDYSVTVKFNSDKSMVESFSFNNYETVELWHTSDDWRSTYSVVKSISGDNIPKSNNVTGTSFRVAGESTCNHVLSTVHTISNRTTWTSSGSAKWNNVESRLIEHSCDENSYIIISFGGE